MMAIFAHLKLFLVARVAFCSSVESRTYCATLGKFYRQRIVHTKLDILDIKFQHPQSDFAWQFMRATKSVDFPVLTRIEQQKFQTIAGDGRAWEATSRVLSGAFGAVYLGADINTNEKVAMKFAVGEKGARQLIAEANNLAALHMVPGVPQLVHIGLYRESGEQPLDLTSNRAMLVMTKIPGHSLDTVLRHTATGRFSDEEDVLKCGLQIAYILKDTHGRGVPHGDLKLANVMFDRPTEDLFVVDWDGSGTHTAQYASPKQVEGGRATAVDDYGALKWIIYEIDEKMLGHSVENRLPKGTRKQNWAKHIREYDLTFRNNVLVPKFGRDNWRVQIWDVIYEAELIRDRYDMEPPDISAAVEKILRDALHAIWND